MKKLQGSKIQLRKTLLYAQILLMNRQNKINFIKYLHTKIMFKTYTK